MHVRPELEAMVKSLVVVAWADGLMHREESAVLDALVLAFALDDDTSKRLRAFAQTPKTLDDLPTAQLSEPDRRALLQHAMLLMHVDGEQHASELATIRELAKR